MKKPEVKKDKQTEKKIDPPKRINSNDPLKFSLGEVSDQLKKLKLLID